MAEKIALSMIVKGTGDEPKKLDRALSSVSPHVDGIFVTLTGPLEEMAPAEEVCRKYGARVSYHRPLWTATEEAVDWLKAFFSKDPHMQVGDQVFLFDAARNFSLEQISREEYPWVFWMDCDDILAGGQELRQLVEEAKTTGIEAYYFRYLYQVELDEKEQIKHVLIEHLRERLVRNHGVYKWVANIHETLIEQRPTKKIDAYGCQVVHLSTDVERQQSLQRNIKSLELSIYNTLGKDPRPIYYLAKLFFDLRNPSYDDGAIHLILRYLQGDNPSGWAEERAQAYEYLSEIYRRKKEYNNAVKSGMNALIEQPENPSIYLSIASSYMFKQDWERALFWTRLASTIPHKKTTLVVNPKDLQTKTLEVIYNCSVNLNRVDDAWSAAQKMVELCPNDPIAVNTYRFIEMVRQQRELTRGILDISNYLRATGEVQKIKALTSAVPRTIEDNPFMIDLIRQNNPPTVWGEKDVAIYCGPGFTPWSPKKLEEPGECFVGGSEEAVCYMAESLVKQGWNVTVYADPGADEGIIHGVTWLPYYKFNRGDYFNILIGWRDVRFFDGNFNAKQTYLWCHDIQNPIEFTKERVDKISKVMFLSQWHRNNVPDLPEEKIILTSNGVLV